MKLLHLPVFDFVTNINNYKSLQIALKMKGQRLEELERLYYKLRIVDVKTVSITVCCNIMNYMSFSP
jgi:hypothetical protein